MGALPGDVGSLRSVRSVVVVARPPIGIGFPCQFTVEHAVRSTRLGGRIVRIPQEDP